MTTPTPRPEQIAALTRGHTIPLPALPAVTLDVLAEGLIAAWKEVAATLLGMVGNGSEAELNSLLAIQLNRLGDSEPCWEMLVSGVSRGRESLSYDGAHLEKRPDLSIHLSGRNFDFPLVVECKLIDRAEGKTVGKYCADGLLRFINGNYAWMCAEAFMLAYVRDDNCISNALTPHLAADTAKSNRYATFSLPHRLSGLADQALSHHQRNFQYLPPNGSPGPIALRHIWLPAPKS